MTFILGGSPGPNRAFGFIFPASEPSHPLLLIYDGNSEENRSSVDIYSIPKSPSDTSSYRGLVAYENVTDDSFHRMENQRSIKHIPQEDREMLLAGADQIVEESRPSKFNHFA